MRIFISVFIFVLSLSLSFPTFSKDSILLFKGADTASIRVFFVDDEDARKCGVSVNVAKTAYAFSLKHSSLIIVTPETLPDLLVDLSIFPIILKRDGIEQACLVSYGITVLAQFPQASPLYSSSWTQSYNQVWARNYQTFARFKGQPSQLDMAIDTLMKSFITKYNNDNE
jgi:hypothetical protein